MSFPEFSRKENIVVSLKLQFTEDRKNNFVAEKRPNLIFI